MKVKFLHENISEEEILFALVAEEVDEASAMRGELYLGFGAFSFELGSMSPSKVSSSFSEKF